MEFLTQKIRKIRQKLLFFLFRIFNSLQFLNFHLFGFFLFQNCANIKMRFSLIKKHGIIELFCDYSSQITIFADLKKILHDYE